MKNLDVYAAPIPFSNAQIKLTAPVGSTLQDIVNAAMPQRFAGAPVGAVVMINGEVIPRAHWSQVRPKPGPHNIAVRIIPQGGGGRGRKNPIASLLSIAVMIAAPYIAGAILGPALAATQVGLGSLTYGGLLSGAIGVVGKLLVSAIAPPPKPSNLGVTGNSGAGNPSESPTQFIEGARNSMVPFGVIPVNLGTNRMFPPQAARPYTESVGSDQYVRQIFTYGYAQQIEITERKIGESLLSNFSDYEMEDRLDGDLHEGTGLYTNDVYQQELGVLLDYAAGFVVRTTQPDADEAIVDLTLPEGLVRYDNEGRRKPARVTYRVEYAPIGTSGENILVEERELELWQKEAVRVPIRIVFPTRGQYNIYAKRVTEDAESDTIFDRVIWTGIKSFTYQAPINLQGLCGTAIRIRATDQLNGALDLFNVVASTHVPDYDVDTDTWIVRATSNPASLYRYVLQGAPNGRRLPDSKINIEDLQEWHIYCAAQGYTYNRVIDYETSVDEVCRDIASAGAASPNIVDGKRTVAVDRVKDDIVQIITPRNSWGYSGEMIYPEAPDAFRVQFRNKEKGYGQDERIVYADGFTAANALKFEVLEWQSCDNASLAFKHGRRQHASIKQRPETHTWNMDVEHLVALRGNRVKLAHDAPIVGIGDARIKTVLTDGNSPALVTGITLDDTISVPTMGTYYVRIRCEDNVNIYKEVVASPGNYTAFNFVVPFSIADTPLPGDLCYFVEAGGELDLILTKIEPSADLSAKCTGHNYAQPEISDSENAAIPAFDSKLTTPLEFIRPLPPVLVQAQSDENAMLINSDGTYTARAIFTLDNQNGNDVIPFVRFRPSGASQFTRANILEGNPERVVLAGMEDNNRYDIHIFYKRGNSSVYSPPLEINNYLFIGAGGDPADVENFKITVAGETALLSWDANPDIDLSHYELRFSPLYTGATWESAPVLEEIIYENRVSVPFRGGTYLIKALDQSDPPNESAAAAAVITYDPGTISNAIVTISESPDFAGTHDNTVATGSALVMADPSLGVGYYYFEDVFDLGEVYTDTSVTATIVAGGTWINNMFDMDDMFAEDDLFGAGQNDLFAMDDMFTSEDLFGIGTGAWSQELQYAITTEDPGASPVTWTDWAPLTQGLYTFRAIKFREKLESFEQNISPEIQTLIVNIDMKDRIERGEDLTVPVSGVSVTFTPAFKVTPAVVITIQDGEADDKVEFTAKSSSGFSFRVYNETATAYVERSFDYIASGYGRESV